MAENNSGGKTPPFGKPSNLVKNEITIPSKLIQSRRKAQLKAHNKRLKGLTARNKNKQQKNSFFKTMKNTATGRLLFLKGKSRAVKRKLETIKEKKRNKEFKEQMTIENFLASIRNKKDDKMRQSAEKYYTDIAKGSEATTQQGKKKREELRNAYETTVSIETLYNEKIAPYVGKVPNFNNANNAHEYSFDTSMAHAATIAREEAGKVIQSKIKEAKEKAKEKAKQIVGAGAGAVAAEVDELEELLKSLKM